MYKSFKLRSSLMNVVAAIILVSCYTSTGTGVNADLQHLERLALNQEISKIGLSEAPALAANYEEVVKKYQATTGSKVGLLIDSIPPEGVLVGILDPETKRPMPIPACFAAQGAQELMFVPATLLEEAALLLQDYYKARPDSDKVQIISVSDIEDWLQLLRKTGPGIAGEKDRDRHDEVDLSYLFTAKDSSSCQWIRLCREEWMQDALDNIPDQNDTQPYEKFSCGPNSAAKAIHMFGHDMSEDYYRNTFLPNAPFPKKKMNEAGGNMVIGGGAAFVGGILLAPFTGGQSALVGLALYGGGVTAGVGTMVAADVIPDFGIRFADLARYTTKNLPGTKRAKYSSYNDWRTCAETIRDDLRRGDPVVVMWIASAVSGHYINVVGMSVDENDFPTEFIMMDTSNELFSLSCEDMECFMKRQFASWALVGGTDCRNYHMLRFYR